MILRTFVTLFAAATLASVVWLGLEPQESRPTTNVTAARVAFQLVDPRLNEISGMAASRRNPGLYYVHNDSGSGPVLFALDGSGAIRAEIRLSGATNRDWEDMSIAPGRDKGTFDVCIADIGDNREGRPDIVIYRFPEPELSQPSSGPVRNSALYFEPVALRLKYPDGAHNAEAFAVHPRTGDAIILTKKLDGGSDAYVLRAPWPSGEATLERVGPVPLPASVRPAQIVTGADFSPSGDRLVVRCYVDGWEWRLDVASGFEAVLTTIQSRTPDRLDLPAQEQTETVCFRVDGGAVLTTTEAETGTVSPIDVWETPISP